MTALAVLNKQGKEIGKAEVPKDLFGERVNTRMLHQTVLMYHAAQRQGTASTKERADVSGGGIKPYRQKGTGRARVGSTRSPLFHGGGVTFGPHPREFRYTLPRKIRQAALRESLNAKYQAQALVCIEDLKESFAKTREFAQFLKKLDLTGKTLGLLDGCDAGILRVSRNLARFELKPAQEVNAFDILRHQNVLLTKTALDILLKRIK